MWIKAFTEDMHKEVEKLGIGSTNIEFEMEKINKTAERIESAVDNIYWEVL